MKRSVLVTAVAVAAWAAGSSAGEVTFTARPKATRADGGLKITFGLSAPTDVEVAILDRSGRTV